VLTRSHQWVTRKIAARSAWPRGPSRSRTLQVLGHGHNGFVDSLLAKYWRSVVRVRQSLAHLFWQWSVGDSAVKVGGVTEFVVRILNRSYIRLGGTPSERDSVRGSRGPQELDAHREPGLQQRSAISRLLVPARSAASLGSSSAARSGVGLRLSPAVALSAGTTAGDPRRSVGSGMTEKRVLATDFLTPVWRRWGLEVPTAKQPSDRAGSAIETARQESIDPRTRVAGPIGEAGALGQSPLLEGSTIFTDLNETPVGQVEAPSDRPRVEIRSAPGSSADWAVPILWSATGVLNRAAGDDGKIGDSGVGMAVETAGTALPPEPARDVVSPVARWTRDRRSRYSYSRAFLGPMAGGAPPASIAPAQPDAAAKEAQPLPSNNRVDLIHSRISGRDRSEKAERNRVGSSNQSSGESLVLDRNRNAGDAQRRISGLTQESSPTNSLGRGQLKAIADSVYQLILDRVRRERSMKGW